MKTKENQSASLLNRKAEKPFFPSKEEGYFSKTRSDTFFGNKSTMFGGSKTAASPVQAKLTAGAANDAHEKEADNVADTVMRMPAREHDELQRQPLTANISPFVQKQAADTPGTQTATVPDGVADRISAAQGGGSTMDSGTRSFMENRFGNDFSAVRIHTGTNAVQLSRDLNAQAFTTGNDIYFNEGKYSPGTNAGKHLLAHELTHTIQQGKTTAPAVQRKIGDGHDLKSPRFAGVEKLEDAFDPAGPEIQKGATGLHVRLIQQALTDAGETFKSGIDGKFQGETETAIKSFQAKQGLKGADVTGTINDKTMQLLDNYFLNHGTMAAIPGGMKPSKAPTPAVEWTAGTAPSELSKGTRSLDASEKAEIEKRRTTEVTAPPGGTLPDFKNKIPGNPDTYEKRIEDSTLARVDGQYKSLGKDKAAAHKDPAKLHQWSDIEKVAVVSKRETDRVFGNFATGKAFKQGVNLVDAWDQKEKEFAAGGAAYEQDKVEWRVDKIIQDPRVTGKIDKEHGAVQSRTKLSPGEAKSEAAIIKDIRGRVIAGHRAELIEIHKGWPGFADPDTHQVFIQRFKGKTDKDNRNFMWDMFQTLVHEYIHTLAHSRYSAYAGSLGEKKGGKTYREGMTEYFTKIVLESTAITDALRTEVEGTFHDPGIVHPVPAYGGYAEASNAEAVAGVAGIKNVMAAFFLGKIELIGG